MPAFNSTPKPGQSGHSTTHGTLSIYYQHSNIINVIFVL